MGLYKTGGGDDLSFLANTPNVTSSFNVAASGTKDVTVTQMPRYIVVYATIVATSSVNGCSIVYDVNSGSNVRVGYGSSGIYVDHTSDQNITAITVSKITIQNRSTSNQYHYDVAIWY